MADGKTGKEQTQVVLVVSPPSKQNRVRVQVRGPGTNVKSVTAVVFSKALAEKLEHALEERIASAG